MSSDSVRRLDPWIRQLRTELPLSDVINRVSTQLRTADRDDQYGLAFYLAILIQRSTSTLRYDIYFAAPKPCITRQCACDSFARRGLIAASVYDGRTVVRPLRIERSTSDADDNRMALCAPPIARLLISGCRFHFRHSFNNGRITDAATLRICASKLTLAPQQSAPHSITSWRTRAAFPALRGAQHLRRIDPSASSTAAPEVGTAPGVRYPAHGGDPLS
jgi:hypothetical protein